MGGSTAAAGGIFTGMLVSWETVCSITGRMGSWGESGWVLSRTESATSHIQRIPSLSPPKAAPKLKYSYVVESTLQPCDPGKLSPDLSYA